MKSAVIETFSFADPYQGGVPVAVSVVLGAHDGARGAIATGSRSSAFTPWVQDGGLRFDGPLLDQDVEPDDLSLRTLLHCALERDAILIAVVRAALESPADGTQEALARIVDSDMAPQVMAAALRRQFVAIDEPALTSF